VQYLPKGTYSASTNIFFTPILTMCEPITLAFVFIAAREVWYEQNEASLLFRKKMFINNGGFAFLFFRHSFRGGRFIDIIAASFYPYCVNKEYCSQITVLDKTHVSLFLFIHKYIYYVVWHFVNHGEKIILYCDEQSPPVTFHHSCIHEWTSSMMNDEMLEGSFCCYCFVQFYFIIKACSSNTIVCYF